MPGKNIFICSDGTGNTAVKGRGTNVFKLFEAVDAVGHLETPPKCEQIAIYDDGVGTESLKLIRALAGAFGFGLARNVRQLYAELARNYAPGDDIYMFGFSRGAFTVRTLAGFVNHAGILNPAGLSSGELGAAVGDLYRRYRKNKPALLEYVTTPLSTAGRQIWRATARIFSRAKKKPHNFHPVKTIKFVGVWDTVDAVGFPIPGVAAAWNKIVHHFKFSDSDLPDCVDKACHALAIDEERATFAPTLWNHDPKRTEQVWFAGVHSNVGGGYPKQGMSLVALDWMMRKAEEASGNTLLFAPGLRKQYREAGNVNDNLYDSRSGVSIYYRYRPRDIKALCARAGTPVRVHHTATSRITRQTRGYSPGNLPETFDIVGPGTALREVTLQAAPSTGAPAKAGLKFSGPSGFWKNWRQGVQVVFYAAQVGFISLVLSDDPVTRDMLPVAPAKVEAADGATYRQRLSTWVSSSLSKERLVPWTIGVAGNLVAPVPGEFAQEKIVWPMFKRPGVGLAFVAVFPICFALGMVGRVRQEAINSNTWRNVRIVNALPPGQP